MFSCCAPTKTENEQYEQVIQPDVTSSDSGAPHPSSRSSSSSDRCSEIEAKQEKPAPSITEDDEMEELPVTPRMTQKVQEESVAPSSVDPPPTPEKTAEVVVPRSQGVQGKFLSSAQPRTTPRGAADPKIKAKPTKMVSQVDEKVKKELLKVVGFIREISDKEVKVSPDIPKREKAALLYMFLKAVEYEIEGKKNVIATVMSNITTNAEGEKALATVKVQAAAKCLTFMTKAYYRPILSQLQKPHPTKTPAQIVSDIHNTAKVLLGEKPPSLNERMNPFITDVVARWNWATCKKWQSGSKSEYKTNLTRLVDAFEGCRRSGNAYEPVVKDIEKKVSII